jgi:hypothetical protein
MWSSVAFACHAASENVRGFTGELAAATPSPRPPSPWQSAQRVVYTFAASPPTANLTAGLAGLAGLAGAAFFATGLAEVFVALGASLEHPAKTRANAMSPLDKYFISISFE